MPESFFSPDYVAPLKIRKEPSVEQETSQYNAGLDTDLQNDDDGFEYPYSPRPKFQNFLRASYPFHAPEQPSATTVTLALSQGDIILVHSIHTNGWADGTLLETGARGWLPTNYCEPYDYATMRPLLKALTEFWDIMRSSNDSTLNLYHNHDYMRGMVAGVRFLLEKSDCLTRDSALVKEHDSIRRIRKGLLADLSLLVKASKNVQLSSSTLKSMTELDNLLDDMLLRAFQVVTRAVAFFDVWSKETASIRSPSPLPSTADQRFSSEPTSPSRMPTDANHTTYGTGKRTSAYHSRHNTMQSTSDAQSYLSRQRPASITKPPTLTHRMSYTSGGGIGLKGNLASEQLSDTYDAFLGVLASFLGSHMQSRSSSELLLTTQQAVKSCRKLLEIVEIILEHDFSEGLQQAKDTMYDRISDLVHAAREVFRPLHSEDEDMIYLPDEGHRLVNAATACVSGAGRCVAKARVLLEEIGDFELELKSEHFEPQSPVDNASTKSPVKSHLNSIDSSESTIPAVSRRPSKPHLEIPFEGDTSQDVPATTPATSAFWTPMTDMTDSTESPQSEHSALSQISSAHPTTTQPQQRLSLARTFAKGSESTLVSSARDSGPSFVSQTSTRATSPEVPTKLSPKIVTEEGEYDEETIMEHQFAHELMFNQEGRVIGGTLNAIVERLTSHETTPDPSFSSMVYLTFRLFATPLEFVRALEYRFDYVEQTPRISTPIRLRIANVLKNWLESHWRHDCDEPLLPVITGFVREKIVPLAAAIGNRMLELIEIVAISKSPVVPRTVSSIGKTTTATAAFSDADQPLPPTILSKGQLNALKTWKMGGTNICILDFDPMELARQLTLKASQIYCSILPEELLGGEFQKQTNSLAVNVRAMSTLSTDVSTFVVDSILNLEEAKKRASTIKQWIKIANKCLELHNYDVLMAIVCSINSSTILRLKRTWDLIGSKTKTVFEELKRVIDVSRNYSGLRQRTEALPVPCLPFLGMYLTDLTFVDHGNPTTRELKQGEDTITVINLDKHMKTAKIISFLQRFQIPYKLASVDELQTWLQAEFIRVRAAGEKNFQNQYRRSLRLEPRDQQSVQKSNKIAAFAAMSSLTGKDKFDLFAWTHLKENKEGKERNNSVGS